MDRTKHEPLRVLNPFRALSLVFFEGKACGSKETGGQTQRIDFTILAASNSNCAAASFTIADGVPTGRGFSRGTVT